MKWGRKLPFLFIATTRGAHKRCSMSTPLVNHLPLKGKDLAGSLFPLKNPLCCEATANRLFGLSGDTNTPVGYELLIWFY